MGVEKVSLEGGVDGREGAGLEIGDSVAAAEAKGGDVVGFGGLVFVVECAQPDPLVLLVNLSPPSAVGLRDDTFET